MEGSEGSLLARVVHSPGFTSVSREGGVGLASIWRSWKVRSVCDSAEKGYLLQILNIGGHQVEAMTKII